MTSCPAPRSSSRSARSCSRWYVLDLVRRRRLSEEYSLLWVVATRRASRCSGFSTPLLQWHHPRARHPATRARPCSRSALAFAIAMLLYLSHQAVAARAREPRAGARAGAAARTSVERLRGAGRRERRVSRAIQLLLGLAVSAVCVWLSMRDVRPGRGAGMRCGTPTALGFVAVMALTLIGFWMRAVRWRWLIAAPRPAVHRQPVQRHHDRLHGQQRAAVPARRVRARRGRWRGASGCPRPRCSRPSWSSARSTC